MSFKAGARAADRYLDYFDLDGIRNRLIDKLSGGEIRLVGLIAAIVGNRPLVVLDEPTNDVDPERRMKLWLLIKQLRDDSGTSFLIVTHNVHEAQSIVDRVILMTGGRVIEEGSPNCVIERLQLPVILSFELPVGVIPEDNRYSRVAGTRFELCVKSEDLQQELSALMQGECGEFVQSIRIDHPSLNDALATRLSKERR